MEKYTVAKTISFILNFDNEEYNKVNNRMNDNGKIGLMVNEADRTASPIKKYIFLK